jgi:hypothetical protein
MAIGVLAMVVRRGGVLLRLFVVAVIVVMGRLAVVMGRRLMLRRGIVMMLAGRMLLFLCHGKVSFNSLIHDVSGQSARLNFRHKLQ